MTYVIEDGVPIPPSKCGRPRGIFKPVSDLSKTLALLKPNQSVLLETPREYWCAQRYCERQRDKEYTGRKIAHQGWRIWRVE